MHASLIPSFYLDRVAQTRTVSGGEPLRALADRLRTPLFAPGGVLAELSPTAQSQLQQQAQTLAEVFQRSSSTVEGRNGYLSLRNHQLRGLEHPRKRECLTAVHNFASREQMGQPRRSGFSGRNLGRCLPRFCNLSRYHQRLSVHHGEP